MQTLSDLGEFTGCEVDALLLCIRTRHLGGRCGDKALHLIRQSRDGLGEVGDLRGDELYVRVIRHPALCLLWSHGPRERPSLGELSIVAVVVVPQRVQDDDQKARQCPGMALPSRQDEIDSERENKCDHDPGGVLPEQPHAVNEHTTANAALNALR